MATGGGPWERFLNSAGGATLITVVLGGIMGQFITCTIQQGATRRQLANTFLEEQGKLALSEQKERLDKQLETVSRAYSAIGEMVASSQSIIDITGPPFHLAKFSGKERESVSSQKLRLYKVYNAAQKTWVRDQETLGYLLAYYTQDVSITPIWKQLVSAVETYKDCASDWYFAHNGKPDVDIRPACVTQKSAVGKSLQTLNESLHENARPLWIGWESIDRLKETLDKWD